MDAGQLVFSKLFNEPLAQVSSQYMRTGDNRLERVDEWMLQKAIKYQI